MTTRRQFLTIAGGIAGFVGAGGIAAAGVLAAGAPATRRPGQPTGVPDLLLADTADGLAAVRGARSRLLGASTACTPDGKATYSATADGDGATSLRVLDTGSGRVRSTVSLAGRWVPRTVSTYSRSVALTAPGGAAGAAAVSGAPGPREQTTIVVADGNGQQHRVPLAGNYEPDAFSYDGSRLFVLDWQPALAPEHYRVRVVELATGEVGPLLTRDKSPVPAGAEEEMRGERRQAVFGPDLRTLYTLYTHQPDHEHTRDLLAGGRRSGVHAFVHVLNLELGWAYCLDLPEPFGHHPAAVHTLAVSPDGERLFVADLVTGQLAVADTGSLTVQRVVPVPGIPGGTAYSAVSPDGRSLYLGGGNVLHRVDLATLTSSATWDAGGALRGLAVGRDGTVLYAGYPGEVRWRDPATGAERGRLPVTGLTELRRTV